MRITHRLDHLALGKGRPLIEIILCCTLGLQESCVSRLYQKISRLYQGRRNREFQDEFGRQCMLCNILGRRAAQTPAKFTAKLRRLLEAQRHADFLNGESSFQQQFRVTHPLLGQPFSGRTRTPFIEPAEKRITRHAEVFRESIGVVINTPRPVAELLQKERLRRSRPGEKTIRLHQP